MIGITVAAASAGLGVRTDSPVVPVGRNEVAGPRRPHSSVRSGTDS